MREIKPKDVDCDEVGLYVPIIEAGFDTVNNSVAQVILMRAITHGCGEFEEERAVRHMMEEQVEARYGQMDSSTELVDRV